MASLAFQGAQGVPVEAPRVVFAIVNNLVEVRTAPDFVHRRLGEALSYLAPQMAELGAEGPVEPHELAFGGWDGMVRLYRQPKTKPAWFELGLLPRALEAVARTGLPIQVLDFRKKPDLSADVPRYLNTIPLRDYQADAARAAEAKEGGVIVASPRSGKTRILFELFRRLDLPTIWVAPSVGIVSQTAEAALAWFDKSDVVVLGVDGEVSEPKVQKARLWICTAAKAMSLPEEPCRSRDVVILDEQHHYLKTKGWGRTMHQLFRKAYFWYGATGTHFRSQGDDMALEAVLSGVAYEISSQLLLERGILVPTSVCFLPIHGRVRGDHWRHGVFEHPVRNQLIVDAAERLHQLGKKPIVLVSRKLHGKELRDLLTPKISGDRSARFRAVEFVHSSGQQSDHERLRRKQIFRSFCEGGAVKVLIATQLLGEGIDLPEADALIWARGESAAVSLIQGFYRVATAAPGKKSAIVVDFADLHHARLLEASRQRWRILKRDPTFLPKKVADLSELETLIRSLPQ